MNRFTVYASKSISVLIGRSKSDSESRRRTRNFVYAYALLFTITYNYNFKLVIIISSTYLEVKHGCMYSIQFLILCKISNENLKSCWQVTDALDVIMDVVERWQCGRKNCVERRYWQTH